MFRAKQSVSPKAQTNSRNAENKERKKSSETDRKMAQKLERTQKLMDNFDSTTENTRRPSRDISEQKPVLEKVEEQKNRSQSQVEAQSTSKENQFNEDIPPIPENISLPFVQLPGLNPFIMMRPDFYLPEDDSMSYRPPTPTPSLVSHSSFDPRVFLVKEVC